MKSIDKIITILTKPKWFFSHLKEKGIREAFTMFAILEGIAVILATIIGFAFRDYANNILSSWLGIPLPQVELTAIHYLGSILWSYAFGIILGFVIAGVLYVWISIFGGTANYTKTYQLYAYSKMPQLLLAWIPGIGILAGFYSLALLIIGTVEIHKISLKKSLLIYLIPLGIFIIFLILFFILVLMVFPIAIQSMRLELAPNINTS